MPIKAVAFDVGQTLIHYKNPLNWQALYSPALKQVMDACNFAHSLEADAEAQAILTKYNTRVNYREYEVASDTIFSEILHSWCVDASKLSIAKEAFYSYFRADATCFEDTEFVLQELKKRSIKIGALTDVAYGMDNEYALEDIAPIRHYFNVCLTSNDVGFRKPNAKGFRLLQDAFNLAADEIAFVGDEEKDIVGANNVGFLSILVNRDASGDNKNWGQKHTVCTLSDILAIIIQGE